jgi:hypothetical protein
VVIVHRGGWAFSTATKRELQENGKEVWRKAELPFLLVSLPPFSDPGKESPKRLGELLPLDWVLPGRAGLKGREQFPKTHLTLPRECARKETRRQGEKAVPLFSKPPCRSLAVLPLSLLKKPSPRDER